MGKGGSCGGIGRKKTANGLLYSDASFLSVFSVGFLSPVSQSVTVPPLIFNLLLTSGMVNPMLSRAHFITFGFTPTQTGLSAGICSSQYITTSYDTTHFHGFHDQYHFLADCSIISVATFGRKLYKGRHSMN
ncbi:hypothetical protein ES703_40296 [subsurface metagenome]